MTGFVDIPKPIRSGIVVVDPVRGTPERVIVMQFNPDTLQRSLAPQAAAAEQQGDRTEALRLKGPAVETWKFEANIDATDQLDLPAPDGIHPQLAALEVLIQPPSTRVRANQALAAAGTLEITPIESPLTLFVWGKQRVLPVRLTELTIAEQTFDRELNPIRATVSIGLRVLTTSDLPTGHRGAELYLAHLAQKENLVGLSPASRLVALGPTVFDERSVPVTNPLDAVRAALAAPSSYPRTSRYTASRSPYTPHRTVGTCPTCGGCYPTRPAWPRSPSTWYARATAST